MELSSIIFFRKYNIYIKGIKVARGEFGLRRLNSVIEKIRSRKVIASIALVCIIAFSVAYSFTQTKTGFAVLTTPPPGIPGPYYVTAEAKIYGPVVDLAAIKSKMSGTYAPDYTYVQWGTNPFYRVYVDNTIQEVYYGQMIEVMTQFSSGRGIDQMFSVENDFRSTFDTLRNTGALDPTSLLGEIRYFGNMPGVFIAYHAGVPHVIDDYVNVSSSQWYAVEGRSVWGAYFQIFLNETLCLKVSGYDPAMNSSGSSASFYRLRLTSAGQHIYASATFYFKDLAGIQKALDPRAELRIYTVIDSPGTGFISKYVSPSSLIIGSTITITVRLDPPSASNMNITDLYPNTFAWTGGQVTLQKFRIGVGLVETAFVSVTPTPAGSNMKIQINYDQAPSILQSLLSDEYIYMSYTLTAPTTSGEYTLPSASMEYSIPLPQP